MPDITEMPELLKAIAQYLDEKLIKYYWGDTTRYAIYTPIIKVERGAIEINLELDKIIVHDMRNRKWKKLSPEDPAMFQILLGAIKKVQKKPLELRGGTNQNKLDKV